MAGTITHYWDGTKLVVTSDSGTSACDLKGAKGDVGVRGAQGAPGVLAEVTEPIADTDAANKAYVDAMLDKANTWNGANTFTGALTLPNSPDNADTATITEAFASREVANKSTTGIDVVDNTTAEVLKIEGTTKQSRNLIPYPYAFTSFNEDGITATVKEDGKIEISGTNNRGDFKNIILCDQLYLPAGSYSVEFTGGESNSYLLVSEFVNGSWAKNYSTDNLKNTFTFTALANTWYRVYLVLRAGFSSSVPIEYSVMINEGLAPLPYEVGGGVKHSSFKEIVSIGRNLLPYIPPKEPTVTNSNGITYVQYPDGSILVNGTATAPATLLLFYAFQDTSIAYLPEGQLCCISCGTEDTTIKRLRLRVGLYDKKMNWLQSFDSAYSATFTVPENLGYISADIHCESDMAIDNVLLKPMINIGTVPLDYEPYKLEHYELPEAVELAKNDCINPQEQLLARYSNTVTLTGDEDGFYNDHISTYGQVTFSIYGNEMDANVYAVIANTHGLTCNRGNSLGSSIAISTSKDYTIDTFRQFLRNAYNTGNPLKITYPLQTPKFESIGIGYGYQVKAGGVEAVDTSNGLAPTITTQYLINENPKEAATKAYINNGLAKKVDKTGGIITGSLTVERGFTSEAPALVVKNSEGAFGLAYDNDAFKLGFGETDGAGNFTFYAGEGLPVALRDDSTAFKDGELLVWNATYNKLAPAGITLAELQAKLAKIN